MSLVPYVRATLLRDLQALKREIAAYPTERALWAVPAGIQNSAGTLALHLAGNLRHFIGTRLGGTSYVRDRPAEFGTRDVSPAELVAEVDRAIADVGAALDAFEPTRLGDLFPDAVGGVHVTIGDFLVHLVSHTSYHLGQIDYHRRIVTGTGATVGAIAVAELASATPAPA